jgi:hypothetical protein
MAEDMERIELPESMKGKAPEKIKYYRTEIAGVLSNIMVDVSPDYLLGILPGDIFLYDDEKFVFLGAYMDFPIVYQGGSSFVAYKDGDNSACFISKEKIIYGLREHSVKKIGHQDIL